MANNDKPATPFVIEGIKTFEARGGSRSILCAQDGYVAGRIESIVEKGLAKTGSGNFVLTTIVITEDADPGMNNVLLYRSITVTGTNSRGEPNVQQLGQVMASTGSTQEQVRALEGKSVTAEALNKTLKGRKCYVQVRAEVNNNGREISDISNFVTKETFDAEVKAGNHRQNHIYGKGAHTGGNGAATHGSAGVAVATVTAPPAAAVTDMDL